MNQKLEVDRISLNPPLKTTGTMTWQERFRQKWEGANTGGYNAISTPVMDEIIKDIFQAVEEDRNRIIEMIEKRRMENRKFSMGVWDGADASYRDILSIINQTK